MTVPLSGNLVLKISHRENAESPGPHAVFLDQVHGTDVVYDPPGNTRADGLVCTRGTSYPGLRVADCLPVFALWKNFTGAAHAGWRGLAGGIVEKLLLSVDEPLELLILGPCICADCYEVGEDVRRAISCDDPGGLDNHPEGRADLRGSALRRARRVVPGGFQVLNLDRCTRETENLFSFRRDGTGGRNLLWLAEASPCSHILHPYHGSRHTAPPRGE